MKFECAATVLNMRNSPDGTVVGEIRLRDSLIVEDGKASVVWVEAKVTSGVSSGRSGFFRRKWLAQQFDSSPTLAKGDRNAVAQIITQRTKEFDAVTYGLGSKARDWSDLKKNPVVDCSGWVYLLASEILAGTSGGAKFAKTLHTFSDEQITRIGDSTK